MIILGPLCALLLLLFRPGLPRINIEGEKYGCNSTPRDAPTRVLIIEESSPAALPIERTARLVSRSHRAVERFRVFLCHEPKCDRAIRYPGSIYPSRRWTFTRRARTGALGET